MSEQYMSVHVTRLHGLTCQRTIIFNHRISEPSRLSLLVVVTDTLTATLIITYKCWRINILSSCKPNYLINTIPFIYCLYNL